MRLELTRDTTNRIRFVMEELIPPIFRDSTVFCWLMERVWGRHIRNLADFRRRAPFLTPDEYEQLYRAHPRVHAASDNSERCIRQVISDVIGSSVCDIGCGTGYLLTRIREKKPEIYYTGVDFVEYANHSKNNGFEFKRAMAEDLPFGDDAFDTVICTHVLEHILDYRKALMELRRVCRRRLIIVVPQEREARFTFNPHFQFFPYPESLLRAIHPIPDNYECFCIGRDIYYREEKSEQGQPAAAGRQTTGAVHLAML